MKIHLVTYATPRFRHRQLILGWSAMAHQVVDTVTNWTPQKLHAAGFEKRCKDTKLSERGSGFWAWKPFIIDAKLWEIPEGDLVFYCDVGRRFPYKILDRPLTPFINWMNLMGQDCMPGLQIFWRGPLSTWTKRDAFALTEMDHPSAWAAPTVQASFSLWRAGPDSRVLNGKWLQWCADRRLISDDPSTCGKPEQPDFYEHRHDQSLLSLLCLQSDIRGYDAGPYSPSIDTRDPSAFLGHYFQVPPHPLPVVWRLLRPWIALAERVEKLLRRLIQINPELPSHPLASD